MNYIVSNNGAGIAVGLVGNKEEAECLAILSENLYNTNHSDDYFTHLIYMPNIKKLKQLLTMRAYYNEWDKYWASVNHYKTNEGEEKVTMIKVSVLKLTKAAIRTANEIMSNNVNMENFMQNISNHSQTYSLGSIYTEKQDEDN